jgi:hypothetical protein
MATKGQYAEARVSNAIETLLTILATDDTSSIFDCRGTSPAGLILPSNFTAGNITFLVSRLPDPSTFVPLANFDGSVYTVAAAPTQWLPLHPALFNAIPYFMIQTSNVQATETVIEAVLIPVFQGIHN